MENGNNNTLKAKGYHLEHNVGHGQTNLSSVLVALNILAFLLHTHLDAADGGYRLVRAALPTRKTFFEHLRALTTYLCFPSWSAMLDFMRQLPGEVPAGSAPSHRNRASRALRAMPSGFLPRRVANRARLRGLSRAAWAGMHRKRAPRMTSLPTALSKEP